MLCGLERPSFVYVYEYDYVYVDVLKVLLAHHLNKDVGEAVSGHR